MDLVNWRTLLTHPSELVRLDEQLRLKQLELAQFTERQEGWTKIAAQENLEHKRMIYSMRCYISITCNNMFHVSMLSDSEYQSLKRSFVETENIVKPTDQEYAILNHLAYKEYFQILYQRSDKYNTERLYRKLIGKIIETLDTTIEKDMKINMIDTIVTKCFFTVK